MPKNNNGINGISQVVTQYWRVWFEASCALTISDVIIGGTWHYFKFLNVFFSNSVSLLFILFLFFYFYQAHNNTISYLVHWYTFRVALVVFTVHQTFIPAVVAILLRMHSLCWLPCNCMLVVITTPWVLYLTWIFHADCHFSKLLTESRKINWDG